MPRIRQNLAVINEEPVYHILQSRIHLIPKQSGQEFCQQYIQNPLQTPLTTHTTAVQKYLSEEITALLLLASSNAASSTSKASKDSVDIYFLCNKSFQKYGLKRHQFYSKKT